MRTTLAMVLVMALAVVLTSVAPSAQTGKGDKAQKKLQDLNDDFKLSLHLQKDIKRPGIKSQVLVGVGVYCEGDTGKFEATQTTVTSSELRSLLKASVDSKNKPEFELKFDDKGDLSQGFYVGIRLNDAKAAPILAKQIKDRFKFDVPIRLKFFYDRESRLYVDVESAK